MTLKHVLAHFECDRCRKDFRVVMERGDPIPNGWDLDDLAADAVRGGELYIAPREVVTFDSPSVTEAGEHLCPACTDVDDGKHAEAGHG
ncbi:hypothetical protein MCBMB27_02602 [Methylobacterium phyllosphaerae]|uniref:Uncharacterized protein n=1 Tax=Methylobacterium phyllosphaerae TaxID=418223 RepID=A0AAE8L6Y0_9HYPH|nr:hypothetical protein [Methylobacterium phyllosphaerae]APT31893.1 hypothetical protein MCBMB27_02602 [Methylobacterium phyllosphaerae]SFH01991.1 hypothetical protein SAMN05192567_11265 [Methylobacterium phyllosphaerae]